MDMKSSNYSLGDIAEIRELSDFEHVNAYLTAGWRLIATHTTDFGHPVERHQKTMYSLAWIRESGTALHPENPRTIRFREEFKEFRERDERILKSRREKSKSS